MSQMAAPNPFLSFVWQGRGEAAPPAKRVKRVPALDPCWEARLASLSKGASLEMAGMVNRNNALGLSKLRGNFALFALEQKQRHPTHVVLMRKGEFYEAMGVDAIMIVEHTQANPHRSRGTRKLETLMAGVPRSNLHSTLERLVEQGLRIAVYEEMHSGMGVAGRELSQIVSPCNPSYVNGEGPLPPHFGEGRPLVGVHWGELGHTMYEICLTSRTVQEWGGLSSEVLHARLQLRSPLVLYTQGMPTLVVKQYRHLEVVSLDDYDDFKGIMLRHMERDMGVDVSEFQHTELSRSEQGPQPLHLWTAQQLGVLPCPGVPSLVDRLVPAAAPAACRAFLREWLLTPPPDLIAKCSKATA